MPSPATTRSPRTGSTTGTTTPRCNRKPHGSGCVARGSGSRMSPGRPCAGFARRVSRPARLPSWPRRATRTTPRRTRRGSGTGGVVCVPLSTTPGLRLPVGWYVLRAFGVSLSALLARWAGVGTPWVHLYFHPWEASDLRPWLGAHPLARGTGPGWVTSLRRLLERVAPQLLPSTVGAAVEAWRADPLRGA